jgi:hypothetical protein
MPIRKERCKDLDAYNLKLAKIKKKESLESPCKYCDVDLVYGGNIILKKGKICCSCLFSSYYNKADAEEGFVKCTGCNKNKINTDYIHINNYKHCLKCRDGQMCRRAKAGENNSGTGTADKADSKYVKIKLDMLEVLFNKIKNNELKTSTELLNYLNQ